MTMNFKGILQTNKDATQVGVDFMEGIADVAAKNGLSSDEMMLALLVELSIMQTAIKLGMQITLGIGEAEVEELIKKVQDTISTKAPKVMEEIKSEGLFGFKSKFNKS